MMHLLFLIFFATASVAYPLNSPKDNEISTRVQSDFTSITMNSTQENNAGTRALYGLKRQAVCCSDGICMDCGGQK
ncbi:hypothetical protein K435DRAFT_963759 [Dendrothele bispora CBS 962.96]|uniref:Uncharacterized protein n=1 Tax=Dendrothele bispora (strain CBS 962.96) TaxID=1314807 RepID=A0A4S8MEA6_DENBC|nr:hypothetical protein K435DRAFT_963759 [Dendrothele bispora CBS 962.96]